MGRRVGLVAVVFAVGCASSPSAPETEKDVAPVAVMVNGAVEKGPFLLGSSVSVTPASDVATDVATAIGAARAGGEPSGDPASNSSGRVFKTETSNDRGEFAVAVEYQGYATVEGTGYYYNEATGKLSASVLTLRAFHEIGATDTKINVNLLTHLTYQRVQHLVSTGVDAAAAIEQAEGELHVGLGLGAPDVAASDLNLAAGNNDNSAYLFAVSTLFAQAARLDSSVSADAKLQELLNTTSSTFASTGTIPADVVAKLVHARARTNNESVMKALAARFEDTGSTVEVPDLNRIIPWTMPADVTACAANVLPSEPLACRLAVCGASARPEKRSELEPSQKAMSSEECGEECWAASRCAIQQCAMTNDSGVEFLDSTCMSQNCGIGFVEGSQTRLASAQVDLIFDAVRNGDCE